jgi:hypothetical protein
VYGNMVWVQLAQDSIRLLEFLLTGNSSLGSMKVYLQTVDRSDRVRRQ